MTRLDPTREDSETEAFRASLGRLVVGQERALDAITDVYRAHRVGLSPPRRPIGTLCFLGPTGSGKTRTVEAVAETLFGNPKAILKIDCAEFQYGHEIARLLGPPPGYIGHDNTLPFITQEKLDRYRTEASNLSLVLFDEIEKAHYSLWQLLLGVLDKGTMTLGNNKTVDFTRSLIVMTSNVGSKQIQDTLAPRFGFSGAQSADKALDSLCIEAAKRHFLPEFVGRIDKFVVFHQLNKEQTEQVLALEVDALQQRLFLAGTPFVLHLNQNVKNFILREGISKQYGARSLKNALERLLTKPIASMIATKQIRKGDYIIADCKGDTITFSRK